MKKPASAVVLGILNVVFGGLGTIFAVVALILVIATFATLGWSIIYRLLSLTSAVLLLVSGIGMLNGHRFGWTLGVFWSFYVITLNLTCLLILALAGSHSIPYISSYEAVGDIRASVLLTVTGLVLGMLYPVIQAILLLTSTRLRQFFGENVGEETTFIPRLTTHLEGAAANGQDTSPHTIVINRAGQEHAQLVELRGRSVLKTHELVVIGHDGTSLRNTIGRDAACQVALPADPTVGSRHCEIRKNSSGYLTLTDLAAANRTWIARDPNNQIVVNGETVLIDGDCIHVGNTVLKLRTARTDEVSHCV